MVAGELAALEEDRPTAGRNHQTSALLHRVPSRPALHEALGGGLDGAQVDAWVETAPAAPLEAEHLVRAAVRVDQRSQPLAVGLGEITSVIDRAGAHDGEISQRLRLVADRAKLGRLLAAEDAAVVAKPDNRRRALAPQRAHRNPPAAHLLPLGCPT